MSKDSRIGRGAGSKRGVITPAAQAARIIESVCRRRDAGESVGINAYQPTFAITAELQRQLSPAEWAELNY